MSQASANSAADSAATYGSGSATSGNSTPPWLIGGLLAAALLLWFILKKGK